MKPERPKQLLMIAYYFPPLGGAGVQRSAKFAKYLARLGWQLEVVTIAPPAFEPVDASLESELDQSAIRIHRVQAPEPFRGLDCFPGGWRLRNCLQEWLLFPDRMAGWHKPALQMADILCAAVPGIPIFTTSAPYTAHLIGMALKERYQSYWIADFRDEWSQNPWLGAPTPWHLQRHVASERQVLTLADQVITVTDPIREGLQSLIPKNDNKFWTIPNGFDPDDFRDLTLQKSPRFNLTHVGTLNSSRAGLLKPLLTVVSNLLASQAIASEQFQFNLIGPANLQDLALQDFHWLHIYDYLPHREALQAMANSDLLVLAEANPKAYTGKIFEYLGLNKPILGLVHPMSPAGELIRKAKAGWVAGFDTQSDLAAIVLNCYRAWQNGAAVLTPHSEVISEFSRQRQAARLAELILKGQTDDR